MTFRYSEPALCCFVLPPEALIALLKSLVGTLDYGDVYIIEAPEVRCDFIFKDF